MCAHCKEKLDARGPLRPIGVAELRRAAPGSIKVRLQIRHLAGRIGRCDLRRLAALECAGVGADSRRSRTWT